MSIRREYDQLPNILKRGCGKRFLASFGLDHVVSGSELGGDLRRRHALFQHHHHQCCETIAMTALRQETLLDVSMMMDRIGLNPVSINVPSV
jgi:hypothetical protein